MYRPPAPFATFFRALFTEPSAPHGSAGPPLPRHAEPRTPPGARRCPVPDLAARQARRRRPL